MQRITLVLALFLLVLYGMAPARAGSELQAVLAAPSIEIDGQVLDRAALEAVYAPRRYQELWTSSERAAQVLRVLSASTQHGLNPADYHVEAITRHLAAGGGLALDLLLTDGLMRYASDVRVGMVSPRQVRAFRFNTSQPIDPVAMVLQAAEASDLEAYLAAIPPRSAVYGGLVQALAKLRLIEATGGWIQIADGRKLEPGDRSSRVVELRKRLAATGELGEAQLNEDQAYDDALVEAVKAYQRRHGLEDDGVIGRGTLAMLNIPVEYRIRQVLANMERLRWQPDALGERYVYVNVPAYQLIAASHGQVNLSMKVIVGRTQRPTPIFSDNIRMVEFNPDWHVPPTIAREDVLPHLVENPYYALEHKNVRMYQNGVEVDPATVDWSTANIRDFRLRAPPGPRNPLGTVKFLFPNRFDVYLHDTSEPNLFAKTERAISSGCVRVADPASLANWLLGPDQAEWSNEKRERILASERQTRLIMKTPVPVYLAYITAWLGEDGLPAFRPDIYKLDDQVIEALESAAQKPRRLAVTMLRANTASPADPVLTGGQVPQAAP